MAFGELARMLHAANTIFERAASEANLSKRAAQALVMMTLDTEPNEIFTNEWLRDQLLLTRISTERSVAKDASSAKSELQAVEYIRIGLRNNEFLVTDGGRAIVRTIHEAVNSAIDGLDLPEELRSIVRRLSTMNSIRVPRIGPQGQGVPQAGRKTG